MLNKGHLINFSLGFVSSGLNQERAVQGQLSFCRNILQS